MPGFALNDIENLDDPAPAWQFRVRMPLIQGLLLNGAMVESISLPFNNTTSGGRYTGGSKTYYPEMTDISAVTIDFYEDVNYTVMNYLLRWRSLVVNPSSYFYGLPADYKQPIEWELYNGVNNIPVIAGVLFGCWPTDIQPFPINGASTDRIKISHTFSVDSMKVLVTSPKALATNVGLDIAGYMLNGAGLSLPSTGGILNTVTNLF